MRPHTSKYHFPHFVNSTVWLKNISLRNKLFERVVKSPPCIWFFFRLIPNFQHCVKPACALMEIGNADAEFYPISDKHYCKRSSVVRCPLQNLSLCHRFMSIYWHIYIIYLNAILVKCNKWQLASKMNRHIFSQQNPKAFDEKGCFCTMCHKNPHHRSCLTERFRVLHLHEEEKKHYPRLNCKRFI